MRRETPTPRIAVLLFAASALVGTATPAAAPADPVAQQEPLQCWWRTSTAAVRVAEPFTLLLTCSIVDSSLQRVVVDQAKLGPDAIPLSPFEVIGGGSIAELQSGDRTFFQRAYRVRILTEKMGADIAIPSVVVSYQLATESASGAETRGIERRHELPALPMRVLSLVPAEAADIREAAVETFEAVDDAAFGASLYRSAGLVVMGVGAIGLVLALATGLRARRTTDTSSLPLQDRLILRHLGRELQDIRSAREGEGWTPDVVTRALASTRVVASYVTRRPPSQRVIDAKAEVPTGVLVHTDHRGRRTLIASSLTAAALRRGGDVQWTAVGEALARLTGALYGRDAPPDPASLDAALDAATAALADVKREHAWATRARAAAAERYRAIRIPWFR